MVWISNEWNFEESLLLCLPIREGYYEIPRLGNKDVHLDGDWNNHGHSLPLPNGHKLNVKSFQAGMRGICPYCGVKFTVPSETTQEDRQKRESQATGTIATATGLRKSGRAVGGTRGNAKGGTGKKKVKPDPLDEDSQAVWYVRPPSGGQFGPADADVMRTWMKEGRVTADSLVWREGWRDWVEAVHRCFPSWHCDAGCLTTARPPPRLRRRSRRRKLKPGAKGKEPKRPTGESPNPAADEAKYFRRGKRETGRS